MLCIPGFSSRGWQGLSWLTRVRSKWPKMLCYYKTEKGASRKIPIPGWICTVFIKSEELSYCAFWDGGQSRNGFFLFFFLTFSFHELRGLKKSCCSGGVQNFSLGTFRHLYRSGSGWFGFLCSLEFSFANIFSFWVVLPEICGWDFSFAEWPLPCCYFLHLHYFLFINSRGKSLKELRAACGHSGLEQDGFLCTTRWSKKN